jgi:hypothetical protein
MKKILEGEELERRARELGVDIYDYTVGSLLRRKRVPDYELQRRVIEAERSIRESRLWQLALISAIASVASAAAALLAVLSKFR